MGKKISGTVFRDVIEASAEPLMLVRVDHPDWPVDFANPAFRSIAGDTALSGPFADVGETMFGRDVALDLSEAIRAREETRFPVDVAGMEAIVVVRPTAKTYCAISLRPTSGALSAAGEDLSEALSKARRRLRDLKRDDPTTGLLNQQAFRDMLTHDWAVASREKTSLALVHFSLVDFDAYIDVFGRHASESCVKRVGRAIRRCLRRASDVVARFDERSFVVLAHSADEEAVGRFAATIAETVRELGLHHPRSSGDRFVTVNYRYRVASADARAKSPESFLAEVTDSSNS